MRGFGGPSILLAASILVCGLSPGYAQTSVSFPDPKLDAAVRGTLGKPSGPLTTDDLKGLTYLYATGQQITNLSGLEYATNLVSVTLSFNLIKDVGPLSSLPNLTSLELQSNPLSSVNSLTGLTKLVTLNIGFNGIHDASPLLALTNLTKLDISFNPLTDCTVLGGMVSLTNLALAQVSIPDASFLNVLTNLLSLNLINSDLTTLPPLPGLWKLTSLNVGYNQITNASAIAGLTNLESLALNQSPISDVAFLAALPQLRGLYLQYDKISDLSPLAGLTNLDTLMVNGNLFTNAAVMGNLTNLTMLYAASCSLKDVSFLSSLTRLGTLALTANRLTEFPAMPSLTNVHYLFLDQNRLTNIAGLESLPGLASVSLLHNLLDLTPGSPAMVVVSNLQSRFVYVNWLPQNEPPAFYLPASISIPSGRTSVSPITITDDVIPSADLVVTVASANTNLVPTVSISPPSYDSGSEWNLLVTAATNQTGTTTLLLTATDDAGRATNANLTLEVFFTPEVHFPDTSLELAVRETLGIYTEPLTTYDLLSLTYLNASYRGISDLSGLEWATNLTTVSLSGNTLTDLTPLAALPQLQCLDVGNCGLKDLSLIHTSTNITTLTLDGNPVHSLSALAVLTNLTSLSAAYCSLSDLAGAGSLVHLQSLQLGYNGVRDPAPLTSLTNLTYLDLSGNALASLASLSSLPKLQRLSLSACSLKSLNGLQGLTNLQYFYAESNAIHDVSPLAGLTKLIFLFLDRNPIAGVNALSGLADLQVLSLNNCALNSLSSLQGLKPLEQLLVANDGIRDLAPLSGLTNLSMVYLSGNAPTNLAPLQGLRALATLHLASCSLSNVSPLGMMTNLLSLDLGYNWLTDLSPVLTMSKLDSLYLTANRLTNITGLDGLVALHWVDLTRNLLDVSTGSPSMQVITNLQNQNVWLNYIPQNEPPLFYALRTNWVVRPNATAELQFTVIDDVTRADKVAVSVSCSSAGPLSNSVITLVRTGFYIPPGGPMAPVVPPPTPIGGPTPLQTFARRAAPMVPNGGGGSYWTVSVVPPPGQTGTMDLTLTATDDTGLSTTATVQVTAESPVRVHGTVLEAGDLPWHSGGNAPWFEETNISHTGSSAAQSGAISGYEESWLETSVSGPGILTFWWKLTTTNYGASIAFTTDRGGRLALESMVDWLQAKVSIPTGECVLRWEYTPPVSPSGTAWVDHVTFVPQTPDFWLELYPNPFSSGADVILNGEPGGLYEVQWSADLSQWSRLDRVVLDPINGGFTALVGDSSPTAASRFYRARQLSADTMWFAPLAFDATGSPVLRLFSQPGLPCEILASTNLLNWSAVATITNTTGTLTFTNATADAAKEFYKARRSP
jgi:Leucine-rich repeat (LRR) protein